ncbi:MAG: hypothetical protein Q8O88_01200 [bacterium]|nr:hypothetical protein [bacterium]
MLTTTINDLRTGVGTTAGHSVFGVGSVTTGYKYGTKIERMVGMPVFLNEAAKNLYLDWLILFEMPYPYIDDRSYSADPEPSFPRFSGYTTSSTTAFYTHDNNNLSM